MGLIKRLFSPRPRPQEPATLSAADQDSRDDPRHRKATDSPRAAGATRPDEPAPRRRRRRRRSRNAEAVAAPPRSERRDEPARAADGEDGPRRRRRRRRGGGEANAEISASRDAARHALTSGGYKLPELSALEAIGPDQFPPGFSGLGLSNPLLAALGAMGFKDPTPIQAEAIPPLLEGVDVVGQAQTGTGKTVAFGLPLVEMLDADDDRVQAIVLVPTRELAAQVGAVLDFLARVRGLRATVLMGGRRLSDDFTNLERRPQIVIGTPGRVIDHLRRRTLDLNRVRFAVLDEADRMLDIGFEPDMRRILSRCPAEKQTALFSATIPTPIKTLIWRYMRDPKHIQIEPEVAAARTVAQRYYEVANRDKLRAVEELLPELEGRTLIFCNMKVTVDRLVRRLQDLGLNADAIHGDRDQSKRDRVMGRFRDGSLQFLVATDVAARGLDIEDVTHVINYDIPQSAEDYIHRVGRTGRAGREGSAVSFVGDWDFEAFDKIKAVIGENLHHAELDFYRERATAGRAS